jgi:hypothetical protein
MNLSEVTTDSPITMMFHDGTVNIKNDRKDVFEIDSMKTVAIANAMDDESWFRIKAHPKFLSRFLLVFPTIDLPDHSLSMHGNGVKHVVGLILLTDMALAAGKKPFWRNPEAHLHPSAQLGLGDLLIYYINQMEGQ